MSAHADPFLYTAPALSALVRQPAGIAGLQEGVQNTGSLQGFN